MGPASYSACLQDGVTPLHGAASKDVAALLLDRGAKVDAADQVSVGPAAETWALPAIT
jgi:hypothetical protein